MSDPKAASATAVPSKNWPHENGQPVLSVASGDALQGVLGFAPYPQARSKRFTAAQALEVFDSKIERLPWSGCWIWLGGLVDPKGYGSFKFDGESRAHRSAWALFHGPIPDGLHVLHRCDVPSCVNPAHLFLGTNNDNIADASAKGRLRRTPRDACFRGHSYTLENTLLFPNGNRGCRICRAWADYRRARTLLRKLGELS